MQPLMEIGLLVGLHLFDDQPEAGGEGADVDLVGVLAAGSLKETLERVAGDRIAGRLRNRAAEGDHEPVIALGRDLRKHAAELLAEAEVGLDARVGLLVQVRHVDAVADGAGQQVFGDGFGDLDADVLLRLRGAGPEMRRLDDFRNAAQG